MAHVEGKQVSVFIHFSTNLYKFFQRGFNTSNARLPFPGTLLSRKKLEFRGTEPLFLDYDALFP